MLQRQSLKEQLSDLHRDRFEGTFFKLLDLLRELKRVDIGSADYPLPLIEGALDRLRFTVDQAPSYDDETLRIVIIDKYQASVHKTLEPSLSPYFRTFYTILRKLRGDKILSQSEKIDYGNLLRSQLTSDEVALAGYNALTPQSKDLGELLSEFRMLKYLPDGRHHAALSRLYPALAFSGRDEPSQQKKGGGFAPIDQVAMTL